MKGRKMNTKWFSGIGLAILLSTGALIYTSTTQARPKAAATTAAPDATLENLTTCATEKNPAYVEGVLKGAMNAFDKDAKSAIKAGKPAAFKKSANNLLKVVKFLFAQSKHFSPIYKDAAHKPTFDKDIDKLIQTLLHAEYALAKSQSAQKEVIKDYTALVAELTKDGVGNLTKIAAPSAKAAGSVLDKMKGGLSKAGHAISDGAKKAVAGAKKAAGKVATKAKALVHKVKDKVAPKKAEEEAPADDSGDAPAEEDAPADDSGDAPAEEDAPADDSGDAPADDEEEEPVAQAKNAATGAVKDAATKAFSKLFG